MQKHGKSDNQLLQVAAGQPAVVGSYLMVGRCPLIDGNI